jgi:hypothetical protein
VEPFGFTQRDAKVHGNRTPVADGKSLFREALGPRVRRLADGGDTRAPSERKATRLERVQRSIELLSEKEFTKLTEWFTEHRRERRSKGTRK